MTRSTLVEPAFPLPYWRMSSPLDMGVVRTTFVIDEQGNIERIMPKVKPDTNAAEILEQL